MSQLPVWVLAFCTAVTLSLLLTPLLRRVALTVGMVDRPGDHKSHHVPTPYLGGVAITVSVLVGLGLDGQLSRQVAAIAFSAAILGTVGLVDDDRNVHPGYRFLAQFAAAAAAVAVGIRINATGVAPIDMALTFLWITGVTNAFNLLDNMDGLAAGMAAVVAAAVFALAILAGQPVVATLAAAVIGACVGFLVYNKRPASIFMGDAGSLFLGFVIAILTLDVSPALAPPFGFIIPLVILGLPVLDTTTVTLARLRHGRTPLLGGRDHLSHRLVARGMSRGKAVLVLVGTEAILAVLAVLGGRRVVQIRWVVLGAAVVIAVLAAVTSRVDVYEEPVIGLPRRLKLAVAGLAVGVPVISVPALVALAAATEPTRNGVEAAREALAAVGRGDPVASRAQFERASTAFGRAEARLNGPLVSLGLAVPGVSTNLQATRTLSSIGRDLSKTGRRLHRLTDGAAVDVVGGAVPVGELRDLAGELSDAATVMRRSQQRLLAIDRPFLLPPLQRLVRELDGRLAPETAKVERAAMTAQIMPAVLGKDGPRRYFLAFQDNGELRGTGGSICCWGELTAVDGRVRLSAFGRIEDLNHAVPQDRTLTLPPAFHRQWPDFDPERFWQDVNTSPDFPTTARIISDLYPQSGGGRPDGVMAVDLVGLSALLELTGPVTVPAWDGPLTSANIVDVTVKEAYERFPGGEDPRRAQFFVNLTRSVAEAFVTRDLGGPARLAQVLAQTTRQGHILIHLNRPKEQYVITSHGADGALPSPLGDSLLVVSQNVSDNRVDAHLRRTVRYEVALDPDREPSSVRARVAVTLANETPPGPGGPDLPAGESRSYLSIYSPFHSEGATIDGRPVPLRSERDLDHQAHSTTVAVPPQARRTVVADLTGHVRLSPDGWYRLDILRQPTLDPDGVEVSVTVRGGWEIVETRGADPVGPRRAEVNVGLGRSHTVWVRVARTSDWSRIWDRLRKR